MARPRDADIDRRLLEAAGRLLAEVGYDDLTMEAVAAAAGVSKPSLYRRYPSKARLVFEVLMIGYDSPDMPDTGSFRDDMVGVAVAVGSICERTRGLISDQMSEMASDPAFAGEVLERYMLLTLARQHLVWERGVSRGEVDPAVDGMAALRDLTSAIWVRVGNLHEPATRATLKPVVDRWYGGVALRQPATAQPNR